MQARCADSLLPTLPVPRHRDCIATGHLNSAQPKHSPIQPHPTSSTSPVGSELILLDNMVFLAVNAHRTPGLDSASPSTWDAP